jgi:hypothetical protein
MLKMNDVKFDLFFLKFPHISMFTVAAIEKFETIGQV